MKIRMAERLFDLVGVVEGWFTKEPLLVAYLVTIVLIFVLVVGLTVPTAGEAIGAVIAAVATWLARSRVTPI